MREEKRVFEDKKTYSLTVSSSFKDKWESKQLLSSFGNKVTKSTYFERDFNSSSFLWIESIDPQPKIGTFSVFWRFKECFCINKSREENWWEVRRSWL